jgi:hypothetical protein
MQGGMGVHGKNCRFNFSDESSPVIGGQFRRESIQAICLDAQRRKELKSALFQCVRSTTKRQYFGKTICKRYGGPTVQIAPSTNRDNAQGPVVVSMVVFNCLATTINTLQFLRMWYSTVTDFNLNQSTSPHRSCIESPMVVGRITNSSTFSALFAPECTRSTSSQLNLGASTTLESFQALWWLHLLPYLIDGSHQATSFVTDSLALDWKIARSVRGSS